MKKIPPFHGYTWLSYTKKVFALFLLLLVLSFGVSYFRSMQFVAKGVRLKGELVEGLTREGAMQMVQQKAEAWKSEIITFNDQEGGQYVLKTADLGIALDVDATVGALFKAGRPLWLKADSLSANAVAENHMVKPKFQVKEDQMVGTLEQKLKAGEFPATEAGIAWSSETGWYLKNDRPGKRLIPGEVQRLKNEVTQGLHQSADQKSYSAFYETVYPTLKAEELAPMLEQVKQLNLSPIEIKIGVKTSETLNVAEQPEAWVLLDYENKQVAFNPQKVKQFAEDFAKKNSFAPGEVTLKEVQQFDSEYKRGETYQKAVIEGEFKSGRTIDQAQLESDLLAVMQSADPKRAVDVKFQTIPVVIKSMVPGMEFPDLVSVGQSNYHLGNYPNRVHNIKTALQFQDLTVVAPGETFSYNRVLGWVTIQKGYQNGQVIMGNALVNAPGGGVCQTSTTMFRAIVNGGLPLVKRKNHSWDVHYYQDWHGVDAAVYPPGGVDLMFTNDTPGPLLVHAYADEENEMAYFELYGTRDGRTVRTETVENTRIGAGRKIVTDWEVTYANGMVDKRQIVSRYSR